MATKHNLDITGNGSTNTWNNGNYSLLNGGKYFPIDVCVGTNCASTTYAYIQSGSIGVAEWTLDDIPQTIGESVSVIRVWYAHPSQQIGSGPNGWGIGDITLSLGGQDFSIAYPHTPVVIDGDGDTKWHYVEFDSNNYNFSSLDMSSGPITGNTIQIQAGNIGSFDEDLYIAELYVEVNGDLSEPYTLIRIDGEISKSTEDFEVAQGGIFEVELYHDSSVPVDTTVGFEIVTSPNDTGDFDRETDIESVVVDGVNPLDWIQFGDDLLGQFDSEFFGYSIDIDEDGDTVIIGGGDNTVSNPSYNDDVKVYRYSNGSWSQLGQTIAGTDYHGISVSISDDGNTIAIASRDKDDIAEGNNDAGSVDVYTLSGNTWNQKGQTLYGLDSGDRVGNVRLSKNGSTVALGHIESTNVVVDPVVTYTLMRPIEILDLGGWNAATLHNGIADEVDADISLTDGVNCNNGVDATSGGIIIEIQFETPAETINGESIIGYTLYTHTGGANDDIDKASISVNNGAYSEMQDEDIDGPGGEWESFNFGLPPDGPGIIKVKMLSDSNGDTYMCAAYVKVEYSGATSSSTYDTTGSVTVYKYSGSNWVQRGDEIFPSIDSSENVELLTSTHGLSIDETGDTIAIGATTYDTGNATGAVWVYVWSGSTWNLLGSRIDGDTNTQIGNSASLTANGRKVLIGTTDPSNDGNVYLYSYSALTGWSLEYTFTNPASSTDDFYGFVADISSDGNFVAIGAQAGSTTPEGVIYVYKNDNGWTQLGNSIQGTQSIERFGFSLAISSNGNFIAGGSYLYNDNTLNNIFKLNSGRARVFSSPSIVNYLGTTYIKDTSKTEKIVITIADNLISNGNDKKFRVLFDRFDGIGNTTQLIDQGSFSSWNPTLLAQTFDMVILTGLVNEPPTLDDINDVLVDEDSGATEVDLTGITSGGEVGQPIRLTVVSENTALIPTPTVSIISIDGEATLTFTPVANLSGTAEILVTVEDGGDDNNLSTSTDNLSTTKQFTITVGAVNDPPLIDDNIEDRIILKNAEEQTITFTGVAAGGDESQSLTVTSTSEDSSLIPNPTVVYSSADTTGTIRFQPSTNQIGVTLITITVTDNGGALPDQSTEIFFNVTVIESDSPPTLDHIENIIITENDPQQTVVLTGISAGGNDVQDLRVTAFSSDPSLIPNPTVVYTSPNNTGSIKFTPARDEFGATLVTVRVEDAGADLNLNTPGDNLIATRTFLVTVEELWDVEYYVIDIDLNQDVDGAELDKYDGSSYSYRGKVCHIEPFDPPRITCLRAVGHPTTTLSAIADIGSVLSISGVAISGYPTASTSIDTNGMRADYSVNQHIDMSGRLLPLYTNKIAGDFGDYECAQKLFPIADQSNDYTFGHFITSSGTTTSLYQQIDEGVFVGKEFGQSTLIADDNTFIHPSAVHTDGEFRYSCQVTSPVIRPEETRFRIRAAAPMTTDETQVTPEYTLTEIKFENPEGGLIIQYNDIILRGDSKYFGAGGDRNFATYSSAAKINNTEEFYSWQSGYPNISGDGTYTLTFKLLAVDKGDAFDPGFDPAFEEDYEFPETNMSGNDYLALDGAPLSTMEHGFINPTEGIRISAIEICNSGGTGPRLENFIPLYAEVHAIGNRVQRTLLPANIPTVNFDTTIYPAVSSIWQGYGEGGLTSDNCTVYGGQQLTRHIKNRKDNNYISLAKAYGGGVADSGKLTLKMSHTDRSDTIRNKTRGAFDFGFGSGITGTCIRNGPFNRVNTYDDPQVNDGFFVVDRDCITLRIRAKKEAGTRDYVLDVVGYSDDCILNISSAVGGFLQNASGNDNGNFPISSGFSSPDHLALAGASVSERDLYFEASGNNLGEDHYSLVDGPVVNSTDFEWYEVPLKVYDDTVTIGASRDYRMSSMFEHLYLDIFPLPSGAAISQVEMLVTYAPQNALSMITEGGENIRKIISSDQPQGKILPSGRQTNDTYINAGSGYAPLSTISGIPQAYTTNSTLKSNYSRRWRGMEGLTEGAFDQTPFSFGFKNPMLDYPFLSGFYNFSNDTGLTVNPIVGNLTGTITSNYSPYRLKNLGWRFTDPNLFSETLPGYTGEYQTIDWSSLSNGGSNFQDHPLYGQIADAFDTTIRVSGHNSNINFGDIDIIPGSGFGMYLRFSPDVNASGEGFDLFNSGCLFSKWDDGNNLEFALGYTDGVLKGWARDDVGTIHTIEDTVAYTGYQFPLSVILTYNDKGSQRLKLYTDNEFETNWSVLRATSSSQFTLDTGNSNFVIGNSTGSGVGFNMFVTEVGISNSGNLVESNADATYKQITTQKFLENNRVFWWDAEDAAEDDPYTLWDNVNEDTRNDWTLGDFKYAPFSLAFSQISKRTGRDLINFKIINDGDPYYAITNQTLPSTIDSGVSYHTQIENDFLRFNLSDSDDRFHSVFRRITKDLPRGYKFAEDALVVETVLEHQTENNIAWSGGQIGPKLIVSLYTKNQEPPSYRIPVESPNWGLINRDIHYIEPSSCFIRLDSKFTYDSVCDKSEEWAIFPIEATLKEFKEKYYSQDIDDMFLQYDLVYPSGGAYESRIDIHSAHIRMENAYVNEVEDSGIMNLMSSGGYVVDENLNLMTYNGLTQVSGEMNLYTVGPIQIESFGASAYGLSGMPLYTSGVLASREDLSLFTHSFVTVQAGSGAEPGPTLHTSGEEPTEHSGVVNLYTLGKGVVTSQSGDRVGISLTAVNTQTSNIPGGFVDPSGGDLMHLYAFGSTAGSTGVEARMPVFMLNSSQTYVPGGGPGAGGPIGSSGIINMTTLGGAVQFSRYPSSSMNMFLKTGYASLSGDVNLYIHNDPSDSFVFSSGSMNLTTANYGGNGSNFFMWFNENNGTGIEVADDSYASKVSSDEIRGVDLIGYGSCTGNSPNKVIDESIVTDGVVWRAATCVEGGIARAKNTYTNLDAGYSGDYYGIRKYTELIPHVPYLATLTVKTGNTESIKVPREFEEWEYGINSTINYSGIKLIGDDPYMSGDPTNIPVSGRNAGDRYGSAVAVNGDLMAIGAPFKHIPDEEDILIKDAGSVYLYRRNEDVPGGKADWVLENTLVLPSGFRRDFISREIDSVINFGSWTIGGNKWNVGQEGRELGHSVDIAVSGNRETVVVGAPGAGWSRTFDTIIESGIPVTMMVFTDKFKYDEAEIGSFGNVADRNKVLYRYFSAPWNAKADEFQPRVDVNLLVFQLSYYDDLKPEVNSNINWFNHSYISRMDDKHLLDGGASKESIRNEMFSGIQEAFLDMNPFDDTKPHSGIPPILGVFRDNTASTITSFEDAVDQFVTFYNEYTLESGVFDQIAEVPANGHVKQIPAESVNFIQSSIQLLTDTLDTGNLIANDALKFITSGVGQEWANENAYQFQIPPASGGRVYIFEKENDQFNLVQEIKSKTEREFTAAFSNDGPNNYAINLGSIPSTRFGHAVAISDDTNMMTVGSPYDQNSCEIFERSESEHNRMLDNTRNWLVHKEMETEISRYDLLFSTSGTRHSAQQIYYELSTSDKFLLRTDESFWTAINTGRVTSGPIQLYKNIYTFGYGNIPSTGTWAFIPGGFAGSSRLGYSTAISKDGNVAAFGAPTDSFNEFDDTNVWYQSKNTWASYTNAGAVRVFENRQYFPHSGVVEFFRFGNLDKNMHGEEDALGYYDEMEQIYSVDDRPFTRLPFDNIEIPEEAGLTYIITPELDAASDEIIQNIKDWMALGDRTLVLVGNDPVWEDNGLYKDSNKVINKILEKLGASLRIYPARNQFESLASARTQDDVFIDKYNVIASTRPQHSISTTINAASVFASGVGDIRIDASRYLGENHGDGTYSPCNELNTTCVPTLKQAGDLRVEHNYTCRKTVGNVTFDVPYKVSWPFQFANPGTIPDCNTPPIPSINRPGFAPVPILVAAEDVAAKKRTIPATEPTTRRERRAVYRTITVPGRRVNGFKFDKYQDDSIAFSIAEDSNSDISSVNLTSFEFGTFTDPDPVDAAEPGEYRDAIIYGTGDKIPDGTVPYDYVLEDETIAMTKETYFKDDGVETTSSVYLMAQLVYESQNALGMGASTDDEPNNSDNNRFFYNNLVMENCNNTGAGTVWQLGGWTGRTSFKDAYKNSELLQLLDGNFQTVNENVILDANIDNSLVDVMWIANPTKLPTTSDVEIIKEWLALGDKKLVITYGFNVTTAQYVTEILDLFGMTSKPYISTSDEVDSGYRKATLRDNYNILNDIPKGQQLGSDISIEGCPTGYGWRDGYTLNTEVVKGLVYSGQTGGAQTDPDNRVGVLFFSIKLGSNTTKILSFNGYADKITEIRQRSKPDVYFVPAANASVTFSVTEDTGYRLYINNVSEFKGEFLNLWMNTENISYPFGDLWQKDIEYIPEEEFYEPTLYATTPTYITEKEVDIYIPEGVTSITFTFKSPDNSAGLGRPNGQTILPDTVEYEFLEREGCLPSTTRLLSISGCPLEILDTFKDIESTQYNEFSHWEYYDVEVPGRPAYDIIIPATLRPIMTDNTKYCNPDDPDCGNGGTLVPDGPVVVAMEQESFTGHTNGRVRSNIVVISDSSMVQGQNAAYRSDALGENQAFMRSLYPLSPGLPDDDGNFFTRGKNFEQVQKLLAPERGSPGKLAALINIADPHNNGLRSRFGGSEYTDTLDASDFTDTENDTNPGDIYREPDPDTGEKIRAEVEIFEDSVIPNFGIFPRFSGEIDGELYLDARRGGGVPDLLAKRGKDYLDLDVFMSGYPGDLFGYDISMHENKLVVGAPFNAFGSGNPGNPVIGWANVVESGTDVMKFSGNGGAGAVFYFERTGSGVNATGTLLPWEYKDKIKPEGLSVGLDNADIANLTSNKGAHSLTGPFVQNNAHRTDVFGRAVSITYDMMAVGAPCHDFETIHQDVYESGNTAFIRKAFNNEFKIHRHESFDLGRSGIRIVDFEGDSGKMVLNNGAVYTFKRQITDWPTRTKTWQFAEKLDPQGYSDRNTDLAFVSGCENDYFGRSIDLDRAFRGDSDYTLTVGSPAHKYATSGNHKFSGQPSGNAGAAYTFDAMLREQLPSIPTSESWMTTRVFGDRVAGDLNHLNIKVFQNETGDPIQHQVTGIVFSNVNGDIFLEVSGYDPSPKGFAFHRPYVETVLGETLSGTQATGAMNLMVSGGPNVVDSSINGGLPSGMPLSILGADQANVYNNMNLHLRSWNVMDIGSGNDPFVLTTSGGGFPSDIMNMVMSGQITNQEQLNLQMRGK